MARGTKCLCIYEGPLPAWQGWFLLHGWGLTYRKPVVGNSVVYDKHENLVGR